MAPVPPRTATILVVDDDPASRAFLAEALAALGYAVVQAGTAGEALRLLGQQVPDLVCTDLRMPGMDGFEFIGLARTLAPRLPLILITATSGPATAAEARRRGAAELLAKPVSLSALAGAVSRTLAQGSGRATGEPTPPAAFDATLVQKATQLSLLTQFGSGLGVSPSPGGGLAAGPEARAHAALRSLVERSLDFVLRTLVGDRAGLALSEAGEIFPVAGCGPGHETLPLAALDSRLREDDEASWHGVVDGAPVLAALLAREEGSAGFVCVGRDPGGRPFTWADRDLLAAFASQTAVTLQNAALRRRLESAFRETVTALVVTLEARHKYTEGHSLRVADYAPGIAAAMGQPAELAEQVRTASLLHDVGKVGVPDAVLDKPGRLTSEEWAAMRRHPLLGWKILQPLGFLAAEALTVRHHHERFDGKGYPDGLAGPAIPLGARIVAVADSFDAMTSPRPYRPALGAARAMAEIEEGAGSMYDPEVVAAFRLWYRRRVALDP